MSIKVKTEDRVDKPEANANIVSAAKGLVVSYLKDVSDDLRNWSNKVSAERSKNPFDDGNDFFKSR